MWSGIASLNKYDQKTWRKLKKAGIREEREDKMKLQWSPRMVQWKHELTRGRTSTETFGKIELKEEGIQKLKVVVNCFLSVKGFLDVPNGRKSVPLWTWLGREFKYFATSWPNWRTKYVWVGWTATLHASRFYFTTPNTASAPSRREM